MKILEHLFFRRPRILNALHIVGLVDATSQTNSRELDALARVASGATCALEIGSYQGVSAERIAAALGQGGKLYCVDPWPEMKNRRPNPCFRIFERHVRRRRLRDQIVVLQGYSNQIIDRIPTWLDFIFVDGDHSWRGIEADWTIVKARLCAGGIVCLHDTAVPKDEPWRTLESVEYFEQVIIRDAEFRLIETVDSMNVLVRNG